MRSEGHEVSLSKLCRWFGVPRSTLYYRPREPKTPAMDQELVEQIREVIDENALYGLRRVTAVVRRKTKANRKKIHRILKLNGWQI